MLTSARPPTRAWEVARTVVAPPLSVVECLWEVFVWGSCRARVCAGRGCFLCRCVLCACDLLIVLHTHREKEIDRERLFTRARGRRFESPPTHEMKILGQHIDNTTQRGRLLIELEAADADCLLQTKWISQINTNAPDEPLLLLLLLLLLQRTQRNSICAIIL